MNPVEAEIIQQKRKEHMADSKTHDKQETLSRRLRAALRGHWIDNPGWQDIVALINEAATALEQHPSARVPNVDGQNFYELCQQYRHAQEMMPHGSPNVVQAFDNIREYVKTGKLPWPSYEA